MTLVEKRTHQASQGQHLQVQWVSEASTGRSCSAARDFDASETLEPTDAKKCIEVISQSHYVLRIYWLCNFSARQTLPNDFPQRVLIAVVISKFHPVRMLFQHSEACSLLHYVAGKNYSNQRAALSHGQSYAIRP